MKVFVIVLVVLVGGRHLQGDIWWGWCIGTLHFNHSIENIKN